MRKHTILDNEEDFDNWMAKILATRKDFETGYMEAILEDYKEFRDTRPVISALKQIAIAKGMSKVAKDAVLPRVTLSRALSAKGNPRMDTLFSIIDALGLEISVRAKGSPA